MKKYLYLFLISSIILLGQNKNNSQSYTIRGVATYFFNDNFGYKPDVGAEIYILKKSAKDKYFNEAEHVIGEIIRYQIDYTMDKTARRLGSLSNEQSIKFEEMDKKANTACEAMKLLPNCRKVVADGNGSFYAKVKRGEYFILFVSKNVTHDTITEQNGMLSYSKVSVNEDEEYFVSAEFKP